MKVLIIEDEHLASQKLIRLLKSADSGIEIVDTLTSVEETINWFLRNPAPELIFMDIQLEDGLCFEIFENCRLETPVIFTTAYDEYALKAFKVNSVDYLLKPITQQDLVIAIDKFNHIHKVNYLQLESVVKQMSPSPKERFLLKIRDHYKSIPTINIHGFYISERCTFLFSDTGKSYPVDFSLEQLEQLVDSKIFFRVSRNYIVNYNAIQDMISYSSNKLKILLSNWKENDEIWVSRDRMTEFKRWMDR